MIKYRLICANCNNNGDLKFGPDDKSMITTCPKCNQLYAIIKPNGFQVLTVYKLTRSRAKLIRYILSEGVREDDSNNEHKSV